MDKKTLELLNNTKNFYLGKDWDLEQAKVLESPFQYSSKDLKTHAMCVGMTGSGKTGLCVGLIEEALMDQIPAILIDPKGDLSNLALTFSSLDKKSFQPWISREVAEREGKSVPELAENVASLWKNGLADWGIDEERIQKFNLNKELTIYTPGSTVGVPVSTLEAFDPPTDIESDEEKAEQVEGVVSSLLSLIDPDIDPIGDRSHSFLSNVILKYWKNNQTVNLTTLIRELHTPSIQKVGALHIDSFFPEADRKKLSIKLNNLLAAPSFQTWLKGVPLDIDSFLWSLDGKPKISIFSIAHLDDKERMFFVSLLIQKLISWMRKQSGTSTLRSILYMDEIFGYIPPTENPPTKKGFLTLLKQARAYGLGCVLATQNPVDLDYKALSNIGTWFIGKLQTEQDQDRLIQGLKVLGEENQKSLRDIISNLKSRVFLTKNIHEDELDLFHTRWVMSYLKGPLTNQEVSSLMKDQKDQLFSNSNVDEDKLDKSVVPELPADVAQQFAVIADTTQEVLYSPWLVGDVETTFRGNGKANKTTLKQYCYQKISRYDEKRWVDSEFKNTEVDHGNSPVTSSHQFWQVPKSFLQETHQTIEEELLEYATQNIKLDQFRHQEFDLVSRTGQTKQQFISEVQLRSSEMQDRETKKITVKFEKDLQRMNRKVIQAKRKLEKEKDQYTSQRLQSVVSFGATILGAFLGRKVVSKTNLGKLGTSLNKASRTWQEKEDVAHQSEVIESLEEDIRILKENVEIEVQQIQEKYKNAISGIKINEIFPEKKDVRIRNLYILWQPVEI